MSVDNLEERLARQQEEYANVPAASNGEPDELPPDGDYQALVRAFDFFESKAGTAYFKIELEIALDPEYKGRSVDVIRQLEPRLEQDQESWRKQLSFLKGDLKTLGVPVDTPLTEIRPGSDVLRAVLDVPVEIAIRTSQSINQKTGQPYRNVYINERLGEPMRAGGGDVPPDTSGLPQQQTLAAPAAAAAGNDNDIPF